MTTLLTGTPKGLFVLRKAMTTDPEAGVYFGTNTGLVFASRDAGETWDEAARHLPLVLSVELGAPG